VQQLAQEKEIAANTLSIPHPYLDSMAEASIQNLLTKELEATFATYSTHENASNLN
jgi:hypothetical protein